MAGSGFVQHRRRQMRATQACEQCRSRKQKCDEGSPCSFCKESNLICQYRDTPPAKTDKNMEKLMSYMEAHSAGLTMLSKKLDEMDSRLRRLEQMRPAAEQQAVVKMSKKQRKGSHRTGAHNLLSLWPSFHPLLVAADVRYDENYVMDAEEKGAIRLCLEGSILEGYDGIEIGGQAGMSGLQANGALDLDKSTVNELYDNYMHYIHPMHPFLDRSRLRKAFDRFIERNCSGQTTKRHHDAPPPLKRQRSGSADASNSRRKYPGERSPGNAVVYLVLALGKICAHRQRLPGCLPRNKANGAITVAGRPITASPSGMHAIKASPMSLTATPDSPVDVALSRRSRSYGHSIDSMHDSTPVDIESIPGMAYYLKATEILGDQADGNDLVHAQMFLLAGLYKGQLARLKESMSWYSMAGRALTMLLRRHKLYNEEGWMASGDVKEQLRDSHARIKDKHANLIVLASWTCLQLETDILAELPLPSSDIPKMEGILLVPKGIRLDEASSDEESEKVPPPINPEDEQTLIYYNAQLFLRRRLNVVHRDLYGHDCLDHTVEQVCAILKGHGEILNAWRAGLPPELSWNDDDEPPSNILDARLRGKYYGARFIVNRPFLDYALHIMPRLGKGESIKEIAKDGRGRPRAAADVHLFEAISTMEERNIWQACERCIAAAVKSTLAFDGIPGRLVVTNIHGTAHAQFGNLVVLSATYFSPTTNHLIDKNTYHSLLRRTIRFLEKLAPISPTCEIDASILAKIEGEVFGQ
ncbi:hypothetical protein K470DRAFT_220355 [Piedraia hortae CBS 480.64]|uniref:Zn(2)-C6 fungal-type domain-containing protein n=1 Tax=Piedraia hortae CBS 480.64 TaxID=1314780 RepID=A0A6A7BVT6_9PEZI|nr:hypothetical protein K470DRAFT_220355 [Piedraia hortae CBS 480.64]